VNFYSGIVFASTFKKFQKKIIMMEYLQAAGLMQFRLKRILWWSQRLTWKNSRNY